MRQMGFVSWVFLVLVLGSVAGVGVVAAAPNGNDMTRVAVYGASAAPVEVSSVAAVTTTWGQYKKAWGDGLGLVTSSVGTLSGGKNPAVVVQVALANPKNGSVIQIKDYPVNLLRSVIPNTTVGFSLEITPAMAPLKGKQDFGSGLIIHLTFPSLSKPFFLKVDKKTPVFLSEMVKNPGALPGFVGKVTSEGNGNYLLEVVSWTAGDPCGGG